MSRRTANICGVNNQTAQLLCLCQKAARQETINKPAVVRTNSPDSETETDMQQPALTFTWVQEFTVPSARIGLFASDQFFNQTPQTGNETE